MADNSYLYISSSSHEDLYPTNSPADFKVKLSRGVKAVNFNQWSVALIDIDLPPLRAGYKPSYITILGSFCTPTHYFTSLQPVLQRLYFPQLKKGRPLSIDIPRYVRVNTDGLDVVRLYLQDDQGHPPSFERGELTCTLHLQRD